ncbi:DUF3145 domain-containing protein [Nocardia sp. alder85J]|uniref:DUF3145 domain-containing protein n=1 Tax=Nocardia sp. alder85J TaxID=2862949 RepID=UPI001CD5D8D5|nr:DUF3145 domain-containing protein [Nocardia sp. alder85J]MCX4099033.1 DUF3145 domain-containing protein [Nocardia sp. alder85J]
MRGSSQFADVTAGVVYIHSSPAALCPHIEWTLASTLKSPAKLRWTTQPVAAGQLRTTIEWMGPVGTGGRLAQALRAWPVLRFEVTEDPSEGVDGERYCFVPGLGLWHGITSANGDLMVGELRLRAIVESARGRGSAAEIATEIDRALGTAWDDDLEPYRCGEGAEVTWLRRDVG